ncbi:hypothetical protein [Flavobacterium soyangense]|uniref:Uncharacterized protein n=1 Tax=Flavobacterium soyangense TaxID=2023265 RepID=A0A930XW47_9FLAO|nr:hypothetical protein [Flavobacterium soyangense]MBF2708782.1 hypothetical protein [Flavobacterium soyangense]
MNFLKKLLYWIIGFSIFIGLSAIFPIAAPLVIGVLVFLALMNFGKRINKDNGC